MLKRVKRGQVSLEFMMVFAIMLILLLYSVQNVTFSRGSPSAQTLGIQIAVEEKSAANIIGGAISQVYAQGPGSKVTVYVHFNLLRNSQYLSSSFNINEPVVKIMFLGNYSSLFPPTAENSVIAVAVSEKDSNPVLTGDKRTGIWVQTLYPYNSTSRKEFVVEFSPSSTSSSPPSLPTVLKVVVEWNPEKPVSMYYNASAETLVINIKQGG